MSAKYYAITNCGSSKIILNQFTFNTPSGIYHSADLTNVGGPSDFKGAVYNAIGAEILPGQSKLFSVDHSYDSGPVGVRTGNITVSSMSGRVAVIDTIIEVGQSPTPVPSPVPSSSPSPAPVPVPQGVPVYSLSYSIPGYNSAIVNTPQKITINSFYRRYLGRNAEPDGLEYWDNNITSGNITISQCETNIRNSTEAAAWDGKVWAIEQGDQIEIRLSTQNVPIGTRIPYTISGEAIAIDFVGTSLTGSFTVGANGESTTVITTNPDTVMEGTETVTVSLDNITPTVSTSFKIFDTSAPPPPVGVIRLTSPNQPYPTSAPGGQLRATFEVTGYPDGTKIYAWPTMLPDRFFSTTVLQSFEVENIPNTLRCVVTLSWVLANVSLIGTFEIGFGATDNLLDAQARRNKSLGTGYYNIIDREKYKEQFGVYPEG